jgi:hypothetical protein
MLTPSKGEWCDRFRSEQSSPTGHNSLIEFGGGREDTFFGLSEGVLQVLARRDS